MEMMGAIKKIKRELAGKSENGMFSLYISNNAKITGAPNKEVEKFANENFGNYEKYLKEIKRFIKEDSPKILDALGKEPFFYCQTKGFDPLVDICKLHYHSMFEDVFIDARKKQGKPIGSLLEMNEILKKLSPQINVPSHIIRYIPGINLYLSETEFSMRIIMNLSNPLYGVVPVLPLRKNGELCYAGGRLHNNQDGELSSGTSISSTTSLEETIGLHGKRRLNGITAKEDSFHQWGKFYEDPQLYLSLKSIVEDVKKGRDLPIITISWKDGECEFLKKSSNDYKDLENHLKQQNTKMLK